MWDIIKWVADCRRGLEFSTTAIRSVLNAIAKLPRVASTGTSFWRISQQRFLRIFRAFAAEPVTSSRHCLLRHLPLNIIALATSSLNRDLCSSGMYWHLYFGIILVFSDFVRLQTRHLVDIDVPSMNRKSELLTKKEARNVSWSFPWRRRYRRTGRFGYNAPLYFASVLCLRFLKAIVVVSLKLK